MSASIRLDPGARGRGRWFALTSDMGATAGAAERLWAARDAPGLVPEDGFEASRSLRAEAGWGLPAFGGRFTGTPNAGVGLDGDGARQETGNRAPAGTLMLKGTVRW